jgi:hypothetical protein
LEQAAAVKSTAGDQATQIQRTVAAATSLDRKSKVATPTDAFGRPRVQRRRAAKTA